MIDSCFGAVVDVLDETRRLADSCGHCGRVSVGEAGVYAIGAMAREMAPLSHLLQRNEICASVVK